MAKGSRGAATVPWIGGHVRESLLLYLVCAIWTKACSEVEYQSEIHFNRGQN